MNKKTILTITALSTTAILSILIITRITQKKNPQKIDSQPPVSSISGNTLNTGKTLRLRGIIKKGTDVYMNHCPEGFYLKDDTGIIQLRTNPPFSSDERGSIDIGNYLNEKVEISGEFQAAICEALICQCDDSVLVDTIN